MDRHLLCILHRQAPVLASLQAGDERCRTYSSCPSISRNISASHCCLVLMITGRYKMYLLTVLLTVYHLDFWRHSNLLLSVLLSGAAFVTQGGA